MLRFQILIRFSRMFKIVRRVQVMTATVTTPKFYISLNSLVKLTCFPSI